jgi:hypothetical protein
MASRLQDEESLGVKVADRLAALRGLLALSPTMAIDELNNLRETLGLRHLLRSETTSP